MQIIQYFLQWIISLGSLEEETDNELIYNI